MTWTQRDPFGEGIATAASVGIGLSSARQQQEENERERKRQEISDKQAADAATAAGIAAADAHKGSVADTDTKTTDLAMKKTTTGWGLAPPPVPHQGTNLSVKQSLENTWAAYNYYVNNRATDQAKDQLVSINDLQAQQHQIDQDALALRTEVHKEIKDQAEIHHWSQADINTAQANADKLVIAAGHDRTTMAAARTRAAAIVQAATVSATSREKIAHNVQVGDDRRHDSTEAGLDRRTNIVQNHEDARAYVHAKNQAAITSAGLNQKNTQAVPLNSSATPIPIPVYGQPATPKPTVTKPPNPTVTKPPVKVRPLTANAKQKPPQVRKLIKNALNLGWTPQQVRQNDPSAAAGLDDDDLQSIQDSPDDDDGS